MMLGIMLGIIVASPVVGCSPSLQVYPGEHDRDAEQLPARAWSWKPDKERSKLCPGPQKYLK